MKLKLKIDPVLKLWQRFNSRRQRLFCCNPLRKWVYCTFPSLFGWASKQEVPCTHVKSHLTFRKRVDPCCRCWWMAVHLDTREGNSLKPTKDVLPQKRIVVAEVCGKAYSKKKKSKQEAFRERRHLHVCDLFTLSWDLDLKSRLDSLMPLDVAYFIVPWYQVWCLWDCECYSLREMDISSFFCVLSFLSFDGRYVVVYWFQVRSL